MRRREKIKINAPLVPCISSQFHIEADGFLNDVSVSVSNVISIVDFSEEVALLKLKRGKIKIVGRELCIAVYENKTVEISGVVRAVEFL